MSTRPTRLPPPAVPPPSQRPSGQSLPHSGRALRPPFTAVAKALATAAATVLSAAAKVGAGGLEAGGRSAAEPDVSLSPAFAELVYELLDAHSDTAELASELTHDGDWVAHLDYLRALQRQGRATLARLSAAPLS